MKKHTLYLLFIFLLTSCSNKLFITGRYASKNSPYGFNLNQDSTFEYKFYQFHAYKYSTGKWRKKGNRTIILNSTRKDITIPLEATESSELKDENLNRFSFEFTSNGIAAKDCECAIIINDTTKEIRRCDSLALVEIKMPVHKLLVEVRKSPLLMTSLRFSLDPLITNSFFAAKEYGSLTKFRITVNDSLFSYKVFDERKLKVKANGVYFYDDKGDRKHWIPRFNQQ
ncbi:MAG: hypothetical protein V9F02_11520 [Chitinophagaceae bacterium]